MACQMRRLNGGGASIRRPLRYIKAVDARSPLLPSPFGEWFAARGWAPRLHQLELVSRAQAGMSTLLIAPTGAG